MPLDSYLGSKLRTTCKTIAWASQLPRLIGLGAERNGAASPHPRNDRFICLGCASDESWNA